MEGLVRLITRVIAGAAAVAILGAGTALALEVRAEAVPGNRNAITARVLDDLGRPAQGAVVSFQLPSAEPSGTFANGLRNDIVVAGEDGRAVVSGIAWGSAGPVTVRVSAVKASTRAATVYEWKPAESVERALPAAMPAAMPTSTSAADTTVPVYRGGGGWSKRLLVVAAIAGSAAVGGLVLRARQANLGAPPGAATPVLPTLAVGTPILTVAKP
jgi:hypothetical protein